MVIGQRTNNDLQKYIQKTKDRVTQTPLKSGGELVCFQRVSSVHYNLQSFLSKPSKRKDVLFEMSTCPECEMRFTRRDHMKRNFNSRHENMKCIPPPPPKETRYDYTPPPPPPPPHHHHQEGYVYTPPPLRGLELSL